MPGPVSDSYPGPPADGPYVPDWCYTKGAKVCPCGHHEGFHNSDGLCLQRRVCQCAGLPADCLTPIEEM